MRSPRYRIIALDLDGTLLNSRKGLSEENRRALEAAAAAGVEIVPTTGRFFDGIPEVVRQLPFLHYAITINGARAEDLRSRREIYRAEIPNRQALEVMTYLDGLPVLYDCYVNNWGWITQGLQDRAAEFAPDEHCLKMLRKLRTPVPELKAHLRETGRSVQKIQFFARTPALRDRYQAEFVQAFPDLAATSSLVNNLEINHPDANKGAALAALAAHLGVPMAETMAFGDGSNDVSMLRAAGLGAAMENAGEPARRAADTVTASCDHDGVARGIWAHLFAEDDRQNT